MTPQIQITNLVPGDWFKNRDTSSIWITAYRILLADPERLKNGHVFDFDRLRIMVFYGQLQYLDTSHVRPELDNDGNLKINAKIETGVTPEGGWLLIIQPYVVDGVEQREYEISTRAGIYAALYAAINGRNMAFEREFDNTAELRDGKFTAHTPPFINPHVFPRPDLSKVRLDSIHKAGRLIEAKEQKERRRIELSLHWFEKALRSLGLDGFVNYWVALETLGMPDTTNVRPLNDSLARAYKMSAQDAAAKFGVGKIFGLRSRIFHNGELLPINQALTEYMEGLYADILLDQLGMPSELKAKAVLEKPDFNLDKLVHITA